MRTGKRNLLLICGLSTGVLETMDSVLFRGYSHVRARGVTHKRRASIPSKGWKVSFKRAFKKREKKRKLMHGRKENGRKDCKMRTFVFQKERSCHKRKRMVRGLVDQNYRVCQKRERRMKRFANQKVRR